MISIFIATTCFYLIFTVTVLSCRHAKMRAQPYVNAMFKSLHAPFKAGGFAYMLYYPLTTTRMLVQIFMLLLIENGIATTVLTILMSLPMLAYLVAVRPFKHWLGNLLAILSEGCLLLTWFFSICHLANPWDNHGTKKTWVIITFVLFVVFAFLALLFALIAVLIALTLWLMTRAGFREPAEESAPYQQMSKPERIKNHSKHKKQRAKDNKAKDNKKAKDLKKA